MSRSSLKKVKFSKADLYVEKGEEIYMSYGPHPNDFLFVECALRGCGWFHQNIHTNQTPPTDGFYLDVNESDALFLDDIIFKDLTFAEIEELIQQRYYGYVFASAL